MTFVFIYHTRWQKNKLAYLLAGSLMFNISFEDNVFKNWSKGSDANSSTNQYSYIKLIPVLMPFTIRTIKMNLQKKLPSTFNVYERYALRKIVKVVYQESSKKNTY